MFLFIYFVSQMIKIGTSSKLMFFIYSMYFKIPILIIILNFTFISLDEIMYFHFLFLQKQNVASQSRNIPQEF